MSHPGSGEERRAEPQGGPAATEPAATEPTVVRVDIEEIDLFTVRDMAGLLTSATGTAEPLVVDLSRVRFLSSAGIEVLVRAALRQRRSGGTMALAGCVDSVMQVVDLCGLAQVIRCFPTVAEARRALAAQG
jgi:anti-anti-sigma factor